MDCISYIFRLLGPPKRALVLPAASPEALVDFVKTTVAKAVSHLLEELFQVPPAASRLSSTDHSNPLVAANDSEVLSIAEEAPGIAEEQLALPSVGFEKVSAAIVK